MKIIFKIARAELRTLFYSPIAWITIVVFFVVSGVQFVTPLEDHAIKQELMLANSPDWDGFKGPLTIDLFLATIQSFAGFFFLFIPLLTMGTINREETSGTMKLLTSSPIRIREIVLGKFAGLMLFNLVLLSSIAFLLLTGYFSIEHAEFNWYLSILLGFFLLSSAYMAIGLFISCLTSYQIVAGIGTFVAFFILNKIGGIWQQFDFFRDLTWFLSMAGRVNPIMSGLITTRELLYFLLIIILFLGLAMIKLKSRQESKKWTISFVRYTGLICVILLLGYFSSRPGYIGYLDVTRDNRVTIDSATQAVLKEMDGSPLTVTLYGNILGGGAVFARPEARNAYIYEMWDWYYRYYPNIKLKYVNYYGIKPGDSSMLKSYPNKTIHQIGNQVAKIFNRDTAYYVKPEEINKLVDLSKEDEYKLLMELEYKGKKSMLRTYGNPIWPKQPNVSASIRKLTRPSLPKVVFVSGHYERSPWRNGQREYGGHSNYQKETKAMINNGMMADTLSLLENDIPANTDLLVLADPRSALAIVEMEKINQYIANGGNAIIYGEPGKQQILNPILNKIGINLEPGKLVAPGPNRQSDIFLGVLNKEGSKLAKTEGMQISQKYDTSLGGASNFIGTCYMTIKDTAGFSAVPIIEHAGKNNMWVENGYYREDSARPSFSPAEGDLQLPEYILSTKLTRKINNKEQRIIVATDGDFMSRDAGSGNSIELGLYSWLVNNEYPVYTKKIFPLDRKVTLGKKAAKILWYTYVYVLPGALLLAGAVMLIRRKRK